MTEGSTLLTGSSVVAIGGRALIIEGPPGAGKSSLALALIDRGATLIGDDGCKLLRQGDAVHASPPPTISGLLEIRNVGIITVPTADQAPVALIVSLQDDAVRLPQSTQHRDLLGCPIPQLDFTPGSIAPAIRAEWALREHGLTFDQ
ncbi:MAG: HPr kinase/phosphatase C-terminal domain-containing protein [Pseudomonadota bacterium]